MPPKPKEKKPISIVDRRLASGSIFAASSRSIPLAEPGRWTLRIVNTQISDQRLWEIQSDKGWVYAEVADLAVDPAEVGFRVQDGRIVRGTQGAEVLMKMELADYKRIQSMKDAENKRQTFGDKTKIKNDIVSAAGAQLGGEAADFLSAHVKNVNISDTKELVSLED